MLKHFEALRLLGLRNPMQFMQHFFSVLPGTSIHVCAKPFACLSVVKLKPQSARSCATGSAYHLLACLHLSILFLRPTGIYVVQPHIKESRQMSAKKLCAKLLNYLCLVALNRRWATLCLASLFIQIDMAWYRRIRFWLMMARSATSRRCNCAWANVRFHHESWSICQSLVKEQLSRKRSPHREFVALYLVGCFWVFDIFGLDVKRCGFLMPSIETCQFYVLLVGFEDGVRWNLYTFKVQYLRDPDAKHRHLHHLYHLHHLCH